MNQIFKKIITNWRVIMLLIFLAFAFIAIQPQIFGNDGVIIKSVVGNSSASLAGIENPSAKLSLMQKEKIVMIDQEEIIDLADYYRVVGTLESNQSVKIETDKDIYILRTTANIPNSEILNSLGLKVAEAPFSNLKKGLDLEGGARVLLKPAEEISADNLEITIDNLKERLNVYGLSDVSVRAAADLSGQDYILIEIAGATEEEVQDLLAKQGKFEATIGNNTVFFGGKKDITYVCRSADCSGIDPQQGCQKLSDGYACRFFFSITLSPEAAARQADSTKDLTIESGESGERYLSEDIVLYLDDKEVDRLKIGAELKGRATTSVQISGSGSGNSQEEAITNSLQSMKKLQTIISTGSLPVKLDILKMDTISPTLSKGFLNNILFVGILAVLSVIAVIMVRYRKIKVILPMAFTIISEMILVLGFAALVGWNLDLAAIAGIIIVAGTAVDHLVIITDEVLRGESTTNSDWKQKIKNAMFIVLGAYFTTCSGMIPLWYAGAGLLKGFAFTTIIGLSFGVLIARPAYAAMIEILLKE